MATSRMYSDIPSEIEQLQLLFGNISEDECRVLVEEFGGSGDSSEIIQNVYETLESSRFSSIRDLVWHIKEDPSYGVRRSSSLHERNSKKDSWTLARSKSSNTINKSVSGAQPTPLDPGAGQSMPFSGTRNPIQVVRFGKTVDAAVVRSYLTKYMQDHEIRCLLYDVFEKRHPKLLILMRGASGSGKSTLANILWSVSMTGEICSADNFFLNRNGQYKFNKSSLTEAHESCRNRCKQALGRGESPIIIDNTNTRVDEMMPYVQMAIEYNYEIKIVEPKTEWKTKPGILANKSIHGVPKRTIEAQLERFEKTTVKSLVDRALKRQGIAKTNYKPDQDLDWGLPPPTPIETWTTPTHGRAVQTAVLTSMMNSMSVSSTPTKLKGATSTPSPTQATQFSWSEPPPNAPPSPLLLSDLVPDLQRGKTRDKSKSKKAAKRNGNTSNSDVNTTGSAPQAFQPIMFEDPAHVEFEKLRKLFPRVNKEEMERIFNLYEGNVDLCASVLMDEGNEMTGSTDQLQLIATEDAAQMTTGYDDNLWDSNSDCTEPHTSNELQEKPSSSSDDCCEELDGLIPFESCIEEGTADDESDTFEMVLPVEFARNLLCIYGEPDDEGRSLSLEELTIKVPADAAFEIYKSLYHNMHKTENEISRSASEESTRSNSPTNNGRSMDDEFNAIAISLSQMELETSSGDPQLAAIIDIETKLTQQTQETLRCYTAQNRTMAQNIHFSLLKQEYHYLDPAVIDEVYIQCFLNVEKTRSWLNEMYPQSTANMQANKTPPVTSTWHLKYNPRDVQLYSADDMKTVEKTYDELEKEWFAQMTKMKEYYGKCKALPNPQIRGYYITEAQKVSETMKKLADEMQYYKALCINAKHKNDQILDLHGLKINGAMRVLKEFLQYKEDEFMKAGTPKMILLIITGQGKHSRNGCPVLQPAVRNFLNQRQYRFHTGKPGSYTVILTRSVVARRK